MVSLPTPERPDGSPSKFITLQLDEHDSRTIGIYLDCSAAELLDVLPRRMVGLDYDKLLALALYLGCNKVIIALIQQAAQILSGAQISHFASRDDDNAQLIRIALRRFASYRSTYVNNNRQIPKTSDPIDHSHDIDALTLLPPRYLAEIFRRSLLRNTTDEIEEYHSWYLSDWEVDAFIEAVRTVPGGPSSDNSWRRHVVQVECECREQHRRMRV